MAWTCSGRTNAELVSNLRSQGLITSSRVAEAMKQVDRAKYCPDARSAYQDSPQPIGYSATISAPHMHAHAAESLLPFLRPDSSVLDIGSGSGYLLAVFHHLVKPREEQRPSSAHAGSRVIGIEHIAQLVEQSRENLVADGLGKAMEERGQIEVVKGDGRLGELRREPPRASASERAAMRARRRAMRAKERPVAMTARRERSCHTPKNDAFPLCRFESTDTTLSFAPQAGRREHRTTPSTSVQPRLPRSSPRWKSSSQGPVVSSSPSRILRPASSKSAARRETIT